MEDRISDLPDEVLHQILCFLPLKYAVRTSILSKRWRTLDVCSIFADLNFIPDFFQDDQSSRCPYLRNYKFNKNIRKKIRRFLYGINKLLRQPRGNNLNIQKFEVMIPFKHQYPRHYGSDSDSLEELISKSSLQSKLDRWMSMVANPGLSVLDLRIFFRPHEYYSFPLSTLEAAKSLKALSLGGFQIWCSSTKHISFPFLEQLSLESVALGDFVMQTLLQGSPLLENLELLDFEGPPILKFQGLSQLKVLRVMDYELSGKIVIDAPCLRVIEIHVDPNVITLVTCPQFLQTLTCGIYHDENAPFQFEGTQLPIQEWFCRFVDNCRFLEHLTIARIPNVNKIHISSTLHALKTLHLNCSKHLVSFEIVAPNLNKFTTVLKKSLQFIRVNASEKLDVELRFYRFYRDCELNNQWYTRWAEFLSYFEHSRALIIVAEKEERCFVPKEKRKGLPRSLFGVKSLELQMLVTWPKNHCNDGCWPRPFYDYVDYMLWLSPRATTLTLRSFTGTEVVIKCLYHESKVVDDNEDNCCEDCSLLKARCWVHSLKQVRIEEFEGDEMEKQNIKNFFQKQVKNLEFIESISDIESLEGDYITATIDFLISLLYIIFH